MPKINLHRTYRYGSRNQRPHQHYADCRRTFSRLADAIHWPSWLVILKDVANETANKMGVSSLYRLNILNCPTWSRIVDFEADQRIRWIPIGADETENRHGHYHAGHLVPKATKCLVITEAKTFSQVKPKCLAN